MNQSLRLYQLNEYIRRVIALNFSESIWINCEIASYKESRGHAYLELIEKSEHSDDIIAQASAAIWRTQLIQIGKKLGSEKESVLQAGKDILIKVKVDFSEKYGFKLIIEDIDLSFTLGKLALRRQEIMMELSKLKLIEKNQQLKLNKVLQRIAVISSENAAGWQDFFNQLKDNIYGFQYEVTLFNSAMQGQRVEAEVVDKLKLIKKSKDTFDCVVIIRGGGGKVDLSDFDNLLIAKTIAEMPIPVITGIGHDIDQSITDIVAHTSLKTPTAVAEFLIQHNAQFEAAMMQSTYQIFQQVLDRLAYEKLLLDKSTQQLNWVTASSLSKANNSIQSAKDQIPYMIANKFQQMNFQLDNIESLLNQLSPEAHFKRGYSVVEKDGKKISTKNKPKIGEEINIYSIIGKMTGKVTQIS